MPDNVSPELSSIFSHFNVTITLNDLLALFAGNPVNIQIDPATIPNILGKNLVISLQQNSLQLQLH